MKKSAKRRHEYNKMNITLNGEDIAFENSLSVVELIEHYKLNPKTVVIELNGDILEKGRYGQTQVNDNDTIEMVVFVGGG
jgi:thiamine biosynthesis protein ThiS